MVGEKPPNPVGNQGEKPRDQSKKKLSNPIEDWGEKPEDQWQCAANR